MIKLQQLAHALALRHHGNFHRAAKSQHLSQPAFSRSIQSLEEALGVTLFDRRNTVATPTLYGEALLTRAAAILAETNELEREIRLLQGLDGGCLSLALGVYAAELSAGRAVGELLRRHPNIRCHAKLHHWRDVADQVLARSIDLGVAEISELKTIARLRVELVGQHEVVLFCRWGHPLQQRDDLAKSDLDAYPVATARIPRRGMGLFPGKCQQDAATGGLIPTVEVDDLATARAVVQGSDAFGAATPVQIEPWLRNGELAVLAYRQPWLRLEYGFIYLEHRMLSPAAEVFMALVREIEVEVAARNRELMDSLFGDSPDGCCIVKQFYVH
jgi:DNA-binding transcriptional LysR family regulator